jgi:ribosomal protein L4
MHACVRAHLARLRRGTAHTKTRWEVRGSSRKLRRQKGTGKARVGDAQSPSRRGGGVVFGPRKKDWGYSVPQKVDELGLRTALSLKWREGSMSVIDRLDWAAIAPDLVKATEEESVAQIEAAREKTAEEVEQAQEEADADRLLETGAGKAAAATAATNDKPVDSESLLESRDAAVAAAAAANPDMPVQVQPLVELSKEEEDRGLTEDATEEDADAKDSDENVPRHHRLSRLRPSTNRLARCLSAQDWSNALFILGQEPPKEFVLSAKNLPEVEHKLVRDADIYTILKRRRIIMDLEAVGQFEDWLDAGVTPQSIRDAFDQGRDGEEDAVELTEQDAEEIDIEADALVPGATRQAVAEQPNA